MLLLLFHLIINYWFYLECTGVFNLCTDTDKERLGRQAIRAIHEQMDDDKDGMIEASESTDVRLFINKIILFFSKMNNYFFSSSVY